MKNNEFFQALNSLGLLVVENVYTGENFPELPYLVWNVATDECDFTTFDSPSGFTSYYQIHVYCDIEYDYSDLISRIRTAVFNAGFSYPEISAVLTDTADVNNLKHIVLECNVNY